MTAFLQWKDFSFQYRSQAEPTLKNINLDIKKGEKVLIVGPSGSGKSTLGQVINGLIPNIYKGTYEGEFLIDGKPSFEQSIYDKSLLVSTVLQDPDGQFIGLSVAEDLAFALENDMVDKATMEQKVSDWAERLYLLDLLDKRPQDLSGGQKQRVSLAGVLIDDSPILLFDEPLANLDPKTGQDTIDLIDRLHHEQQATTIIIEHRLEDVLYRQVDHIILINDGQIVFDGQPNDLLATNLLTENGIREPLYITMLRELGYDVAVGKHLDQLAKLDLSQLDFDREYQAKSAQEREPLLQVKNLNLSYGEDSTIFEDLSLRLYKGEKLAIVGKNGAGKSSLAKALCQFIPTQAQMTYRGQDITGDSIKERADRIGYVLQNPNQMISQSMIKDEVALGLRLRGLSEEEIEPRVEQALKVCGLYPFRQWPISALSFGQKKRVTIASVLVLGAEIIILDEPTAGQDQKHYQEMMDFLDELSQQGHTIVMITHDMQLMLEYAERVLAIADGEIIADSDPVTLLSQEDILSKAHLKTTSLYQMAEMLKVDPRALTQAYMARKEKESV